MKVSFQGQSVTKNYFRGKSLGSYHGIIPADLKSSRGRIKMNSFRGKFQWRDRWHFNPGAKSREGTVQGQGRCSKLGGNWNQGTFQGQSIMKEWFQGQVWSKESGTWEREEPTSKGIISGATGNTRNVHRGNKGCRGSGQETGAKKKVHNKQ